MKINKIELWEVTDDSGGVIFSSKNVKVCDGFLRGYEHAKKEEAAKSICYLCLHRLDPPCGCSGFSPTGILICTSFAKGER